MIEFLRQRGLLRGDARARGPPRRGGTRGDRPLSRDRHGPLVPDGPADLHRQPRPRRGRHRADVPARLLVHALDAPVPFTQKQLRVDIEALEQALPRRSGTSACASPPTSRCRRASIASPRRCASRSTSTSASASRVAFEGNGHESSSALRDELTLLHARVVRRLRGRRQRRRPRSATTSRSGYFFARVDWRRERLSADEERVVFAIDEGPELRVRGIDFARQPLDSVGGAGRGRVGAHLPARPDRARHGRAT